MRTAVHNPAQLSIKQNHTIYAYVVDYIRKYRPLIYLSTPRRPLRYFFWTAPRLDKQEVLRRLREHGISYDESMVITDVDELNRRADLLLSFNGENFINTPEKGFRGMKVYHTQDFQAYCTLNYRALRAAGVDYVFGTGQLDAYSPFFRKMYPGYVGKVLSFPFGYAPRFVSLTPFEKRLGKAIVTGSVNPLSIKDYPTHDTLKTVNGKVVHERVTSPLARLKFYIYYHTLIPESTREFERFYEGRTWPTPYGDNMKWATPFRRIIVEHESELRGILTNMLPKYPQVKKYDFNLVKEFNRHKLSVVDDGLIEIVGAKAYESVACGCVLVCPNLPFYREWGFVDGKTCIMYKDMDLKDFRKKITYYLKHPKRLQLIRAAAERLVRKRYAQSAIADMIQRKVQAAYGAWRRNRRAKVSRLTAEKAVTF